MPATAPAAPATAPTAPPAPAIRFPYDQPALADFHTGARYFGAPRAGGRHHAAVDLLAPHLRPIHAVADGAVVQAPYFFYLGTNALEVSHPGVGIVRYGEIDMHKIVHLKAGDKVKMGDVIAYVGLLSTGSSMLHFELYTGKLRGGLTDRSNPPFERRRDLENPTSLMEKLQKDAFGR